MSKKYKIAMKSRRFAWLCLILGGSVSWANPAPLTWSDLDETMALSLNQDLVFEDSAQYPVGSHLALLSTEGLSAPGVVIMIQTFRMRDCDSLADSHPLSVVALENGRSVVIEQKPSCQLVVQIEGADYYRSSFLIRTPK